MKHGLDAQTLILPGEDEAAYRARLDAWKAGVRPRTPDEESLVEEAARLSWQLDRADRVQAAMLAERYRLAAEDEAARPGREAAEAAQIGERILAGPPVVPCPYPDPDGELAGRTFRGLVHPDAPDHPARLLGRLEATAAGCRWLLDRWAELRAILADDPAAWWGAEERVRAVRLLGLQPIEAADDPTVGAIYLCAFRMDPAGSRVFEDQASELTKAEFLYLLDRLRGRRVARRVPPDRESAREQLIAGVDGVMSGLLARASSHAERESALAATAAELLAFDDSCEGDRIRRFQARLMNALLRTIGKLQKIQHNRTADPGPAPPAAVLAPSHVVANDCVELRNEPNEPGAVVRNEPTAPVGSVGVGQAGSPDGHQNRPDRQPALPAEPQIGPSRAGAFDANPEFPTLCGKNRNEPNEAGAAVRNEPNATGRRSGPSRDPLDEASKQTQPPRDGSDQPGGTGTDGERERSQRTNAETAETAATERTGRGDVPDRSPAGPGIGAGPPEDRTFEGTVSCATDVEDPGSRVGRPAALFPLGPPSGPATSRRSRRLGVGPSFPSPPGVRNPSRSSPRRRDPAARRTISGCDPAGKRK